VWEAFATLSGSSGYGISDPAAYLLIVHPRRLGWLSVNRDARESLSAFEIVASGGIRSTLGASTNEDEAFLLVTDETFLAVGPNAVRVFPEIGSATMTCRVQSNMYASLVATRQPLSIARISGTGLVTPTWPIT